LNKLSGDDYNNDKDSDVDNVEVNGNHIHCMQKYEIQLMFLSSSRHNHIIDS
jgi:hypothetical protein